LDRAVRAWARLAAVAVCLSLSLACERDSEPGEPWTTNSEQRPANPETKSEQQPANQQQPPPDHQPEPASSERRVEQRLEIRGTSFVTGSTPFEWRGISAFRLVEMIARGRESEAVAYLDWAAKHKVTVLRVFLMANNLFQLKPADGLRAAPRLLELAAARGLHVELVALVDTRELEADLDGHVKAVGAIAAAHPNAVVEIANEPWHSTQDKRLHDPAFVKTLAALVPAGIPVALGSAEKDDGYAAGSYATWHSPRSSDDDGWGHVLALARGAGFVSEWKKPLISDEPIGAHAEFNPGRRDNVPERFAAAGALTRLSGLGATFHYEGGLQAEIPAGSELECLNAWNAGLDLLSPAPAGGRFLSSRRLAKIAAITGFRAAFARLYDNEVWIVGVDPAADASVAAAGGWKIERVGTARGVTVFRGRQ
jgi:hypothetical protein